MTTKEFASIPDVLPEGQVGIAKVEHVTVDDGFFAWREGVSPGKYARLYVGGRLYMSDTQMERRSNWMFAYKAHGHVLVAGLGIGMVLTAILDKPEVDSVTVVEKYQDVIDLVAPHYVHPKLTVICADIYEWTPSKGTVYDTIYFDIWPDICTDNLKDMEKLHRRFASKLNRNNPHRWMDSWMKDTLKAQLRRDKKQRWW